MKVFKAIELIVIWVLSWFIALPLIVLTKILNYMTARMMVLMKELGVK